MPTWNAGQYLKFGTERTRPAVDLAARIELDAPREIVDLGCGPGNSTQVLLNRWPAARVVGIDDSAEMIAAAQRAAPDQEWRKGDIATWTAERPVDLVYSNAALQWLPHHLELVRHLASQVASGGALAFQIPSATFATVRTLIHEISHAPTWADRMHGPRAALTMERPEYYYDALVNRADRLDIWETEYLHVLESKHAIVEWITSTGLRPFLAVLDSAVERAEFLAELERRVDAAYETRVDGKVLFPFRRTFVIAYV